MIWYITIATVFLFQNGHVLCNENAPSVRDRFDIDLRNVHYMVTINRYQPEHETNKFLCDGVSIRTHYVVTLATCVNESTDISLIVLEDDKGVKGNTKVISINTNRENIALLRTDKPLTGDNQTMRLPENAFEAAPGSIIDIVCHTLLHIGSGDYTVRLRKVSTKIVDRPTDTNLPNFLFAAENPNNRLAMVYRLAAVGGFGVDSHTRRILKYLITDEVAVLYNWKGREKLSFQNTKIMSLIHSLL